ncbi:hypothetical protein BYT27DRAFT_7090447, partial [Phlegmacium glaucopus]
MPTTPTTPLLLQAGQLPGNRANSAILGSILAAELKDDTAIASDGFIDRLFPKERAPFLIANPVFVALAKKGYWNPGTYSFQKMDYTEFGMAKWLNDIGKTMGDVYHCSSKRFWWHGARNLPPSGAPIIWKPDLVLLSRKYQETMVKNPQRIDWLRIRSFAEVTTESKMPPRMIDTINAKSYLSFILQFDRRFTTALS